MKGIHEGSVYSRPELRSDGKGGARKVIQWYARVRYTGPDGLPHEKKRRCVNRTEANRVKAQLYADIEKEFTAPERLTCKDWFDRWLRLKADSITERTLLDYEDRWRLYLGPALGRRLLAEVRAHDVQIVYDEMRAKGLSARSIEYAHAVARAMFGDALRLELIVRNPTLNTIRPAKKRSKKLILTTAQIPFFLAAAQKDIHATLWHLALGLALRPEEYLGLQWPDVNWPAATLAVQRALIRRRRGGGWYFADTKTGYSERVLSLPGTLLEKLKQHRARQRESQMAARAWAGHDLIFCTRQGEPLAQNNLTNRYLKKILVEARTAIAEANKTARSEIPAIPERGISLYTLRHTGASLMEAAGVATKVLSEILGHHSVAFTLDTYVKTDRKRHAAAAETLEQALFSAPLPAPLIECS